MDVRAGHTRVQHITHDGHGQLAEIALVVPDRVHIEQALGRVRVAAVAGVDDMHVRGHVLGDQIGGT